MKYSAVPPINGRITRWRVDGKESYSQFPYLPVKRYVCITIESDVDDHSIYAGIEESPDQCIWLPFTPDTPPILHRGKGGSPEFCEKSQRVDGKLHTWVFDGDDPWVKCCWCGVRRKA